MNLRCLLIYLSADCCDAVIYHATVNLSIAAGCMGTVHGRYRVLLPALRRQQHPYRSSQYQQLSCCCRRSGTTPPVVDLSTDRLFKCITQDIWGFYTLLSSEYFWNLVCLLVLRLSVLLRIRPTRRNKRVASVSRWANPLVVKSNRAQKHLEIGSQH